MISKGTNDRTSNTFSMASKKELLFSMAWKKELLFYMASKRTFIRRRKGKIESVFSNYFRGITPSPNFYLPDLVVSLQNESQ
jgi:hypothetical protein